MKLIFRLVSISWILLFFTGSGAVAGTIIINIEGLNTSRGGKVYTAVFNQQKFLKFGEQLFGNIKPVTGGQARIVFENVPAGTYGIASFQDTDGSGELSKNFLGIPNEPMGFSRDPRIMFGPPAFEETKITLGANETVELTIHMK